MSGNGGLRIGARLERTIINALSHSMTVHVMERLASRIIPNYDLHERIGFPETVPVPQRDAAQQIVLDMKAEGFVRRFIELLIDVNQNGLMGRKIPIRFLQRIIGEIEEMGFLYNEEYRIFMEAGRGAKTPGWGILRPGQTYDLSFIKVDIVGNTKLVREYPRSTIAKTYNWLKQTVARIVANRNGRLWSWEGDGGLAAFNFNDKNIQSTLAAMELLHELNLYNVFECPLKSPLEIRLAVHTGPCQFLEVTDDIQSATLRQLDLIESRCTEANGLALSPGVYFDLGTKLEKYFEPFRVSNEQFVYRYRLTWE
jgi:hypothetical protein